MILKTLCIKLPKHISKFQLATVISIFFHLIGLIGILVFNSSLIIQATPFNLLLSVVLLIWTQQQKNKYFYLFMLITLVAGFVVEVIGVNTNLLFGNYNYGKVLGFKYYNVPIIIGVNWFITLYCCGTSVHTLLVKLINKIALQTKTASKGLKGISVIVDGAILAVLFDWLIEPVAVKLGFWKWNDNGNIPLYNYISWVVVSIVLLTVFHFLKFKKENKFAVNLLLIQFIFFLILHTFLK